MSISTHGYSLTEHLHVEGVPETSPNDRIRREPILLNSTSAALERVMGLRMMRGRWIADNEPTAVINERLARREFPGQDPIGRRIRLDESEPFMTIVGIVEDLRYSRLNAAPEPELYVPYSQVDGMFGFIALVRTTGDPLALAPALRPLLARIDKTLLYDDVMTLERALAESIAPRRWNLFLLGTFAVSALMLALIGIYGLMTYWVTQRRHEIGVRMAVGAQRRAVVRMVGGQGMSIALAGIGAGVVGALALALVTTALVACCVPALTAARVDPAIALRSE